MNDEVTSWSYHEAGAGAVDLRAKDELKVYVYARDVLTESGLRAQLRAAADVWLEECPSRADIAVVAWPELDDDLRGKVSQLRDAGCHRVLLVVTAVNTTALPRIIESGASGLLRSQDASPERLAEAARATAGDGGFLPADLLGHLLRSAGRSTMCRAVYVPATHRLTDREEAVLKLLADGLDTHQIAEELHYSERTIKGVVHQVIRRFGLRNRSHAVAYALRHGLI